MGASRIETKFDMDDRTNVAAGKFFDGQLERLGLSESAISSQNLDELRHSLQTINDIITHPEQLGVARITITPSTFLAQSAEAQVEVGALPILLERKKLIVERIGDLGGASRIESINQLVDELDDGDVRARLRKELQTQAEAIEAERESIRDMQETSADHRIVIMKERARIWQQYLARESVASIVGGVMMLMMLVFGLALVFAMFVGTAATDIVTNAFLVILGYFFGQAASRSSVDKAAVGEAAVSSDE